jgi:DNA polymerase (family 10)
MDIAMKTEPMRGLSNTEMAAVLFNIATMLRNEGNRNPFRTRAYERGGRALMGLPDEAMRLLETADKVPFRRQQRIGKKLQAKIGEMARTGLLEQYREMVAGLPPHIAGLMSVPGVGPTRADQIYRTLGIGSAEDLVRAASDGRLRHVRGFGPRRTAAIAALDLPNEPAAAEWRQFRLFDLPEAA